MGVGGSFVLCLFSVCANITALTIKFYRPSVVCWTPLTLGLRLHYQWRHKCVFQLPTCSLDDVGGTSFAGSPSLDDVFPNSRHPDALWETALDSLDFLENRLLKESQAKAAMTYCRMTARNLNGDKRAHTQCMKH